VGIIEIKVQSCGERIVEFRHWNSKYRLYEILKRLIWF